MRIGPVNIALCLCLMMFSALAADDPVTLTPEPIELSSTPINETWKRWKGIADVNGAITHRERVTAVAADHNDLWVGTSWGRLLNQNDKGWTLQGRLQGLQITGIAVDGADKVWLSTSDGIRKLDREPGETSWQVDKFLIYYQGHPSFVSGAYLPGEDARRRWGYVDDIYVASMEKSYSPFIVSNEHGLFSFGGYGGVWHHYLPHYTGANSAWLDIRELVPHRRPTCVVEDREGHLWIGTEWDGIVRLNAHGRKYSDRDPDDNEQDGTEFSFFKAKELSVEFDRVVDIAVADERGVWVTVDKQSSGSHLVRFDGSKWSSMSLGEGVALGCVLATAPGEALVSVGGRRQRKGLSRVRWQPREVAPVEGLDEQFRELVKLDDGRVFAASWWGLYEASGR